MRPSLGRREKKGEVPFQFTQVLQTNLAGEESIVKGEGSVEIQLGSKWWNYEEEGWSTMKIRQSLELAGETRSFMMAISTESTEDLDFSMGDPADLLWWNVYAFFPCSGEGAAWRRVWKVDYEGGEIEFEAALYGAQQSFEYYHNGYIPLEARGVFDGMEFTVSDWERLVFVSEDNSCCIGLWGSFWVIFDEPVGDVCGFGVRDTAWSDIQTRAFTLNCDLEEVEERAVLSEEVYDLDP